MESGSVIDYAYGGFTRARWIEGEPETTFWSGLKTRGRRMLTITAYRCMNCGYLEFYAIDDRKEKPKRG